MTEAQAALLDEQVKAFFCCLHGLIKAVERGSGIMGRLTAVVARVVVLLGAWLASKTDY